MTIDETRPTIGEAYGLATQSGNMRVQEKRTDADVIMAAGMVAHASAGRELGVLLLRLQTEFDGVLRLLRSTSAEAPRYEQSARALEKRAAGWHPPMRPAPEVLKHDAAILREVAYRQALSERIMALTQLKTLRQTMVALGAYAILLAERERFMEPPAVINKLADRTLSVFLDPTCHTCSGTGQIGSGYLNQTMRMCDTCGGSGHRRDSIGNGPRARWFAFILLGDMQREVASAAGGMGRKLRASEEVKD